jgi:hypothetical protein
VSCIGITTLEIIRLASFRGENFTSTDVKKLHSKVFFNGSLGLMFANALPKSNFVNSCAMYDEYRHISSIDIVVMHRWHKVIKPPKRPIDIQST